VIGLHAQAPEEEIGYNWGMSSTQILSTPVLSSSVSSSAWEPRIRNLSARFATRAASADEDATFVAQNYAELKAEGFLAAAIPVELGGGGVSHSQMCDLLRVVGQHCGSTALALSMHQHLLAAILWRHRQGQTGAEATLRRVAEQQPVMVSTGARDWTESNGVALKVPGGYRVSGTKAFASQSAGGDLLVTSAQSQDPERGAVVVHFTVPLRADGVVLLDDWDTLGMRGTGSKTVRLTDVFVPDSAVTLVRPQEGFHPVFHVILAVAMPLIMSAYVGIAQRAAALVTEHARQQARRKQHVGPALAAMHNELITAELNWRDLVRMANDLAFTPGMANSHEVVSRKTNTANACMAVVTQALAIAGGPGYYRSFNLERLFRDIQAARYHPLPEPDQLQFSGDHLLAGS